MPELQKTHFSLINKLSSKTVKTWLELRQLLQECTKEFELAELKAHSEESIKGRNRA